MSRRTLNWKLWQTSAELLFEGDRGISQLSLSLNEEQLSDLRRELDKSQEENIELCLELSEKLTIFFKVGGSKNRALIANPEPDRHVCTIVMSHQIRNLFVRRQEVAFHQICQLDGINNLRFCIKVQ